METETQVRELLPDERTEMPSPDSVPQTVTTASAFGGGPILKPDSRDEGQQPEAG